MYKHKRWTCELTGKSNLTYKEALKSERDERLANCQTFPGVWKKLALNMINYNPSSMADLTDFMVDYFRDHIIIGEIVTIGKEVGRVSAAVPITQTDGSTAQSENGIQDVRLNLSLSDFDSPSINETSQPTETASLAEPIETTFGDIGDAFKSSNFQFKVQMLDYYGNVYKTTTMSASNFKRNRNFNKPNFKKFIKDHTIVEMFAGAPFVVKPQLVSVYGLDSKPSQEVIKLMEQARQAKLEAVPVEPKVRKRGTVTKQAVKFPMEDTDLPTHAPRSVEGLVYPEISYDFGRIPENCVERIIQCYSFLSSFSQPLHLSAFTFDDFCASLESRRTSALLCEIYGTCMWFAAMAVKTVILITDETGAVVDPIYEGLDAMERLCIEQWFKWFPGRWATGYEGQRVPSYPSYMRMKAWEVALLGYLRCCELENRNDLVKMLLEGRPSTETDQIEEEPAPEPAESEPEAMIDDETSDLTDVDDLNHISTANPIAKGEIDIDAFIERTSRNYLTSSVEDRVCILYHIIDSVVQQSDRIRAYIEKCIEESVKVKADLRDVVRERKQNETKREDLAKAQREDEIAAGLSAEILGEKAESRDASVEAGIDDENSETSSMLHATTARRSSNRVEELLRREQEKKTQDALQYQAYANSKLGRKQIKQRNEEKKKLEEQERLLAKKEHSLHQRLYIVSAASDTNTLGQDRNHTKYFWFDAAFGSVAILGGGFDEYLNTYKNKVKVRVTSKKAPSGLEWSTGRLFVATPLNGTVDNGDLVFRWGYMDDPDKIDQLYNWLDSRGIRESKLFKRLEAIVEPLAIGMKKRKEDLENNTPVYFVGRKGHRKSNIGYVGHRDYINYLAK